MTDTNQNAQQDPNQCQNMRFLEQKIDYTEKRHELLEKRIDDKLDELILLNTEIVKLQERNNKNSEDIVSLRELFLEQIRTSSGAILRLHNRLDEEIRDAAGIHREQEKIDQAGTTKSQEDLLSLSGKVDKKTGTIREQLDKYKNVAIGVALCGALIFAMGQYIITTTLSNIQTAISENAQAYKDSTSALNAHQLRDAEIDQQIQILQRQVTEILSRVNRMSDK